MPKRKKSDKAEEPKSKRSKKAADSKKSKKKDDEKKKKKKSSKRASQKDEAKSSKPRQKSRFRNAMRRGVKAQKSEVPLMPLERFRRIVQKALDCKDMAQPYNGGTWRLSEPAVKDLESKFQAEVDKFYEPAVGLMGLGTRSKPLNKSGSRTAPRPAKTLRLRHVNMLQSIYTGDYSAANHVDKPAPIPSEWEDTSGY